MSPLTPASQPITGLTGHVGSPFNLFGAFAQAVTSGNQHEAHVVQHMLQRGQPHIQQAWAGQAQQTTPVVPDQIAFDRMMEQSAIYNKHSNIWRILGPNLKQRPLRLELKSLDYGEK